MPFTCGLLETNHFRGVYSSWRLCKDEMSSLIFADGNILPFHGGSGLELDQTVTLEQMKFSWTSCVWLLSISYNLFLAGVTWSTKISPSSNFSLLKFFNSFV